MLQVRVELRAKLEQRLQTDLDGNIISPESQQPGEQVDNDDGDSCRERGLAPAEIEVVEMDPRIRPDRQDVIDDPLDRPVLEQAEIHPDYHQDQAPSDRTEIGAIVADDAAIKTHEVGCPFK